MAKGAIAKVNVANKIQEIFGNDWVGEVDKKLYVWADDGGEKVQIAIALTCPKVPVGELPSAIAEPGTPQVSTPTGNFQTFEITQEEKDNIANLMAKLGL